ncbi:uncharacterized protein LOC134747474 [Cydia strobilella]|uniref:uncharacterized protein LOC134747474 n=1 Tax=Cydia strobilella TaxID=1100964 RepID=UPI003006B602
MSCEDSTVLGDTLTSPSMATRPQLEHTQSEQHESQIHRPNVTLEQISELLDRKLELQKTSIISEINAQLKMEMKTLIQNEIKCCLSNYKAEMDLNMNSLTVDQSVLNKKIDALTLRINSLEAEYTSLKNESKIKEPNNQIDTSIVNNSLASSYVPESNSRKFVVYGIAEYYQESEWDLHNRVIEAFRDLMEVDLVGYIEETYRVGRRSNRNRPLVVELISKRMTKYILKNNHYLRGTGLFISEFLDANSLKERNAMREKMFEARKKGLHAVISNNQLIVDGKIVDLKLTNERQERIIKSDEITSKDIQQPQTANEHDINRTFRNQ